MKARPETDDLLAEAAIEAELIQVLAEAAASYGRALTRLARAVKAIPGSNRQPVLTVAERDDLLITIAQLGGARIEVDARGKISIETDGTAPA